jgi:hypothetical protein
MTDTGKPGQIKAVVFYDENGNGSRDPGEVVLAVIQDRQQMLVAHNSYFVNDL